SMWPAIFGVALVLLGVLSALFPVVGRAVDFAAQKYFRFTRWVVLGVLPACMALWLARFILARSNLWLQVGLLVVWGGLLSCAVILISTEQWRKTLFTL